VRSEILCAAALAALLGGTAALAEDAPAGSAGGASERGAPVAPSVADAGPAAADEVEPRAALEGAIDLAPLRVLAVQDGGRRKPFDSFAREQVKSILGTDAFRGEDPVYTFLSLVFEPERWLAVRAVKIHNLKLIELFRDDVERRFAAGGLSPAEVKARAAAYWKTLGPNYIAFRDVEGPAFRARLAEIDPQDHMTGPNDNAVLELENRFLVFANLPRVVRVAPPPGGAEDAKWLALAELEAHGAGASAGGAASAMDLFRRAGAAWHTGEAAAANEALRGLAAQLTAMQGERAPASWRMRLEVALNRVQPFHVAWMVFFLASLVLGAAVMTQSRGTRVAGTGLHLAGVALALFGIAARTVIVERAPVANLYEAMTFAVFMAVLVGTVFELVYRNAIFGAAAATFGFLALLLADLSPNMDRAINPLVPVLRSYWLNIHVTCMLTSYGTFAVAFLLGVFYFAKYLHARGLGRYAILVPAAIALAGCVPLFWFARTNELMSMMTKSPRATVGLYALALVGAPLLAIGATSLWLAVAGAAKVSYENDLALRTLERYIYRVCQVGFVVITTGIILGAVWANESWGRYWGWDPKETWAFITWLIYGVFIHGRIAGLFRGPRAAIWGIVGFYSVLFTFFGVSFVLPGLHSYLR
jgi:cytochrome c-type biogenesis protein CcsB